jgi:hypothetical protein
MMRRFDMKTGENPHDRQLENKHSNKQRRRAINQLAIGTVVLLWGTLLALKQVGIIEKSISTGPFALTAFGILLVAGGIYRLNRSS